MASVSNQGQTILKETTKEGEVTINLILTIKLENDGLSVTAKPQKNLNLGVNEEDSVTLEIPDFESDNDIINFGRKT